MNSAKNLTVNPRLKQGDSADRLPTDARFVCEYDLYLGVDTIDEEAFSREEAAALKALDDAWTEGSGVGGETTPILPTKSWRSSPASQLRSIVRQPRRAGVDPIRPFKFVGANVGYWIAKRPSNGSDQIDSS